MKPDNLRMQGANSGELSTDEDKTHTLSKQGIFCIGRF